MATAVYSTSTNSEISEGAAKLERSEFVLSMPKIIRKATQYNVQQVGSKAVAKILDRWMNHILQNNMGGGKMLRGTMVSMTYKNLIRNPSEENLERANALGWVIEIIQAASLIADDIMDHSETRRGKPCWYKQPEVQMSAINDAMMVETVAFHVLKIYFEKEPYYRQLYNSIARVLYLTVFGQGLDCLTENAENILESYTMERYDAIVKYKTSYYTIYAPVALGMIMAGKGNDVEYMHKVEQITLQIGHYFQVQDDYLDCFGDPAKTGKVGTDIQDNKCSWLFVKAVELCSSNELRFLLKNYGKTEKECVDNVKKLYNDLGLKDRYREYEDEILEQIKEMVFELQESSTFASPELFLNLLDRLYKRAE